MTSVPSESDLAKLLCEPSIGYVCVLMYNVSHKSHQEARPQAQENRTRWDFAGTEFPFVYLTCLGVISFASCLFRLLPGYHHSTCVPVF
jgi:hypothetical protein